MTVAATASTAVVAPLGRLHGFHPGWYGAVMGTAVVGIVAYQDPGDVTALRDAAHVMGVAMVALAAVLALGLGVPYVGRWFRHPAAALADLRSPVAGALYGTFPGGILVLAVGIATVGPSVASTETVATAVAILAVPGIILAFLISVVFAYLLFVAPEVGPQSANGGWFIPPVVNIVVPLVLLPLLPGAAPDGAVTIIIAGYAFFGMGLLLFLLVASLLYDRLVFHPLPAAPSAPSLWIGLGPVGVGTLVLLRLAQAGAPVWGASAPGGGHALHADRNGAVGVRAVVARRRHPAARRVPASRASALRDRVVGLHLPARGLRGVHAGAGPRVAFGPLEGVAVVLFAALVVFWLVVTAGTLRAMSSGSAWVR